MRGIIMVFFLLSLSGGSVHSQNKELLYDFTDLPQSLMLNPGAETNFKLHAGIPLISQFHINLGLRGASIFDVFGMYQELDFIGYFPKDFAVLAYQGNRDFIDEPFRFSDISASAELLMVYHFGYTKKVNKNLTFGARAKLYSSMLHARTARNKGAFITLDTPQGNNIYQHLISNADVALRTSGIESLINIEEETASAQRKEIKNKLIGRALLGGNLGVGVDLGFTHRINDQLSLTGSVNDLGLILYNKDVLSYSAKGNFLFEGFETPIQFADRDGQDFLEELEAAVPLDTLNTSYIVARPLKLNGSLKYSFNPDLDNSCNCFAEGKQQGYLDAVGVQFFTQFRPKIPQFAMSLFYHKRWARFLRTKVTYTIDDHSFYNLGFLLSTHIYKGNFYISANNLLEYVNLAKARGASLQFGFNFIM